MTSSDAPQPPGGPLRDDQPDGPLAPTSNEQNAVPDSDSEDSSTSSVPPVTRGVEQSEADRALQAENAETSLDQPSS